MKECVDELGMKYLSRQPLSDLAVWAFDLYFFAPKDETQPNSDVNNAENRE